MRLINRVWNWFEQLVPPFPANSKGTPPTGLVRFILFYTRGLWKFLIAVGLLNSLLAAGEALFFVCMGCLVDWTTSTEPYAFMEVHGTKLLVMLLLSGVILPVATLLHSLLLHQTISGNYPMQIRWQVHRQMLDQSMAFFTDEFAGRVATKVMQTAMAVRTAVTKLMDVLVHMLVYIATMLWMLGSADLLLCLPLGIWIVFYTCSIFFFIPKLRSAAQRQSDRRSEMVGRIVDSYVNISTVKLFGGKGREAKFAREAMERYIRSEYRALRFLTLFDVTVQLMNYTLLIGITMLALWVWALGMVTPGSIAVAVAIAIRVINMSRWMMWEVGAIFENIGTVYDGIHTIAKPVTVTDPSKPVQQNSSKGNICFNRVGFSYTENKSILKDLSFCVKAGERVGIVGPSGAGKTTIINLLLRFYDVKSGSITLDGIDVRDYVQDELRDNFAMVSQEPALMHRTVGENITYGCDSDPESMERAAKITDSMSFIENLSDYRGGRGFGTMVGERGVKLSGGQRQRIALARVVLKDAPILILDEATSALDSESEQVVQQNMEKVMEGRTVLAIAHRLSTLSKMDRIIVIDQGQIVESGTHDELLKLDGLYARLWKRQVGGFLGS